jgi:hypothetical protein
MLEQTTLDQLAREYDYRIEAGSARKQNKSGKVEQLQMALQTLGPILQPLAMQGQVGPLNALLSAWANSLDIDVTGMLLPEPPPPPPPTEGLQPGEGGGDGAPDAGPPGPPAQVPPELSP